MDIKKISGRIRNIVEMIMESDPTETYMVEYYNGKYVNVGSYDSVKDAFTNMIRVRTRLSLSGEIDTINPETSKVLYIGGISESNFIVGFATRRYVEDYLDPSKFNDRALYEKFKRACLKCAKTGQYQVGGVNA